MAKARRIPRISQKSIRTMIQTGEAIELNFMDKLLRKHLQVTAISAGIYGKNGAVLEDLRNGDVYAIPERSNVLTFYI